MAKLTELYQNSFLTRALDAKQHTVLAKAMFCRKYTKGDTIIRFGDMGTDYFVLTEGAVQVTVYAPGTNPLSPNLADFVTIEKSLRAEPSAESSAERMIGFGEIALMQNDKRTASIVASTDCETWVLSGDVFKAIIAAGAIKRRNISLQYLNDVELFSGLEQYAKLKLIDGLKVVTVDAGVYLL